jgi:glycosyltransferase involved in cell wall biosynthesis
MRQPRIANFLAHYPKPGGTTTAVRGLSRALVRLGWEVIIYCCDEGQASDRDGADDGIRVMRFGSRGRNPFHVDPRLLARVSQNQDEIDLLVINGMFYAPNLALGTMARRAGIPYVVCPHDPYHPELLRRGRWRKLPYGIFYERPFLNAASAIQVLAEEHKKLLSSYGVRRPVFVVPNGFDGGEAAHSGSEEPGQHTSSEGGPRFLYLGRLDMHHKGLDLLLNALGRGICQGKLPATVRLDFVGADWGDQNKLESLADRLGITQNVRFLGRIPDQTPSAIIALYDLLVLPSRFDGFGLVVLEAMVAAKPVIVSEEAGISSYVEQAHCGYLVKPDSNSITRVLIRAVQTRDEWQSMGGRGKKFAYTHLTWDKSAEQACHEYGKLLHGISTSR